MKEVVFYSTANREKEIFRKENVIHVPRAEEHIYFEGIEYKVICVVHNYDADIVEIYIMRLNSNFVTYKS